MRQNPEAVWITFITYAALAGCLFVWFIHQSQNAINPDNAFLTNAAMQLLGSIRMNEGYYDTNPPMSFLLYIPPALAVLWTGVPIYYAIFGYGCALLALSAFALNMLLRETELYTPPQRQIVLCIYLLCNTIAVNTAFAERDHFIAMALLPLMYLLQATTLKKTVPLNLKWGVLVFGGLALLIKPHYGLFPALVFGHRMITQKRLSVVLDTDFVILAVCTALYITLVLTAFPDFVSIILPDVTRMYALSLDNFAFVTTIQYGLSILLVMLFVQLAFTNERLKIQILLGYALLCLLIFALQGKGYFYQLIPFMMFFSIGLSLVFFKTLTDCCPSVLKDRKYPISIVLICVFFVHNYYTLLQPKIPFLTHTTYQKTELAQIIGQCEGDCSFFMFNDRIDMMHELAVYTGQPLATRFPTMFFLPFLMPENSVFDETEKQKLAQKYTDMLASDFKKFRPQTLIIGRFPLPDGKPFDFLAFLSARNTELRKFFTKYTKEESIVIDQRTYTGGILLTAGNVVYDVYRIGKD